MLDICSSRMGAYPRGACWTFVVLGWGMFQRGMLDICSYRMGVYPRGACWTFVVIVWEYIPEGHVGHL